MAIALGLSFALVIFAVALFFAEDPRDPIVAGRRLSRHLLAAPFHSVPPLGTGFDAQAALAKKAIQASGTNCLPLISRWLDSETPLWRIRIGHLLGRAGILSAAFPFADKRRLGLDALVLHVRGNGTLLVPQLADGCTNADPNFAKNMAATLSIIVSDAGNVAPDVASESVARIERAIASLEARPSGSNSYPHTLLASALQQLDPRKEIRLLLKLDGSDDRQRQGAMRVLSRRGALFDKVRPHLVSDLQSRDLIVLENAIVSTRNFGPAAAALIPHLQALASHPDESTRLLASDALTQIQRQSASRNTR